MNAFETEAAIVARTAIDRARKACTGSSCQQGRRKCETPIACQVPLEEDDDTAFFAELGTAGIVCLIVVILIAVVAAVL